MNEQVIWANTTWENSIVALVNNILGKSIVQRRTEHFRKSLTAVPSEGVEISSQIKTLSKISICL